MIIKPRKLGVIRQVLASPKDFHLWVTALASFDLISPSADLLDEQQLWQTAASTLGQMPLDAGMPKGRPEILVAGDICAPMGEPVTSLTATVEIGSTKKQVVAFGRRYWQHTPDGPVMTSPEPFKHISLTWNNAFGGTEFGKNPEGKGANAVHYLRLNKSAELPMIEIPDKLIHAVRDHPEPAGFGPRKENHPHRQCYVGTYDKTWLRNAYPGMPADLDLRFFNTACEDQWLTEELQGNEFWRITNMHPEHAELTGQLPQFRIRCFVLKTDNTFVELKIRCDTVWFFPKATMGIFVCRGGIPVLHREANDVEHILMGYERISEAARPISHYRDALEERVDPKRAHAILNEQPLKPERGKEVEARIEAERQDLAKEIKNRAERSRERAIATGFYRAGLTTPPRNLFHEIEPLALQIPAVTRTEINRNEVNIEAILAAVNSFRSVIDNQVTAQVARAKEALDDAFGHLADSSQVAKTSTMFHEVSQLAEKMLNTTTKNAKAVVAGNSPSKHVVDEVTEIENEISKFYQHSRASAGNVTESISPSGESISLRKAQNRALRQKDPDSPFEQARALLDQRNFATQHPNTSQASNTFGTKSDPRKDKIDQLIGALRETSQAKTDPDLKGKLSLMASIFAGGINGHQNDAPDATSKATEEKLSQMRDEIDLAEDRTASGIAELRRISPDPVTLESPLSDNESKELGRLIIMLIADKHSLRNRDFAGANLAGSDLSGLDFRGVFLEGANLRGANLVGTRMQNAVLTGADLRKANLRGVDMSNSNLSRTDMRQAHLEGACMNKAVIQHGQWAGADLSGVKLKNNIFLETDIEGTDLTGAFLNEVSFIKCNLSGVCLDTASLCKTVFVETSLVGFSARNTEFESCVLIGIEANGVDLSGMKFVNSSFIGGARLHGAKLVKIDSTRSCWREADLTAADLSGAILNETDLGDTILDEACLHRVSLKRSILHRASANKANFFGANLLEAQARAANLTDASFHRANLYAADLTDAVLNLTDFTGANLVGTIMKLPTDV